MSNQSWVSTSTVSIKPKDVKKYVLIHEIEKKIIFVNEDEFKNKILEKRNDLIYVKNPQKIIYSESNYKTNELYDLVFIDGDHSYKGTMIDLYGADKILKKNGLMIIDDVLHLDVKKSLKKGTYYSTPVKEYRKTLRETEYLSQDTRTSKK